MLWLIKKPRSHPRFPCSDCHPLCPHNQSITPASGTSHFRFPFSVPITEGQPHAPTGSGPRDCNTFASLVLYAFNPPPYAAR